jgi:hypothetical protein
MGKGRRANLERLLLSAWEWQRQFTMESPKDRPDVVQLEESTVYRQVVNFFERPMTGIAIGIVIGAVGGLASLKILLGLAWVVSAVSISREKWRVGTKCVSMLLAAGVLIATWYFTPYPKEPPTAEQNAKALIKLLPAWPSNSQTTPPPQASNQVVQQGNAISFAVQIEAEISRLEPSHTTPYWIAYRSIDGCSVSPADIVLFIRIENLKSVDTMITGYTVDIEPKKTQGTLINLDTITSQVFFIPQKGSKVSNGAGSGVVQIPAGNYIVDMPLNEADMRHAMALDLETMDRVLSNKLLAPRQIVRGWALFEYPHPYSIPVDITVNLTDELDHKYSYLLNLNSVARQGDITPHTTTVKETVDLSGCTQILSYRSN